MTADTPAASGLEQLRAAMANGDLAPIGETIGFRLVAVDEGSAVFAATPERRHYNPIGTVHGGFAATLLDSACGCAVHSRLTATQGFTTLELKVSYLKAMTDRTGEMRAEGRVVSMGRRAAFAEAVLKASDGTVYATATSTLLVFER